MNPKSQENHYQHHGFLLISLLPISENQRQFNGVRVLHRELFTEIDDASALTDKTRYLHKDHLGSVTAISDEAGTVTEYLSYDPHGQRRLADWQPGTPTVAGAETPRGFTGHEMLDGVNLIHMNGRVYDPVLGRFISADPTVQYPQTTQGFNRYTYVNNNPLSFTDPSGFGFFSSIAKFFKKAIKAVSKLLKNPVVLAVIAIAAVIIIQPAVAGLISSTFLPAAAASATAIEASVIAASAYAGTVATVSSAVGGAVAGAVGGLIASGGDLQSAGIGALTGAAFGFVGASSLFGPVGETTLGRVAAHGVIGGTSDALRGGKFGPGLLAGAFAKFATPISKGFGSFGGAIASAVVGGTTAVIGGGKFANGAITGAFGYLLNHCASATNCTTTELLEAAAKGVASIGRGIGNAFRAGARSTGLLGAEEQVRWEQEGKVIDFAFNQYLSNGTVRTEVNRRGHALVVDFNNANRNGYMKAFVFGRAVTGVVLAPAGAVAVIGDFYRAVENGHNALEAAIQGGGFGLSYPNQ